MNKKFKIIFSSLIGFVTISILIFTTLVSKFPGLTLGIKGCEYIVTENSGGYYSIVITKLTGNTLYIPANVIDISIASYIGDNKLDRIVVDYENEEYYVEDECLVKNDRIVLGTNSSTFTFNNNVTTIGQWAFAYCDKIENISIPSTITTIEDFAFANCQNINTIYIPKDVETIKDNVFYECKNLNIYTETPSDNAGWNKYWNCGFQVRYNIEKIVHVNNFQYTLCDERQTATLLKYLGKDEEVVIPDVINYNNITYNVTNALSGALSSCKSITKLVLPTLYGEYLGYLFGAKSYEENSKYIPLTLTYVEIVNAKEIGKGAFYGCNNLASITMPFVGNGSDKTHFGYIFGADSANDNSKYVPSTLKEVKITRTTSIGDYAFYNCSSLTNIDISETVTNIGDYAFAGCSSMTTISISSSVRNIGENVLVECNSLTSITLPFTGNGTSAETHFGYIFGATTYEENSNYVPTSLKKVILKNTSVIYANAFYNCNNLTSLEIPNTLKSIEENAFVNCTRLYEIINNSNLNFMPGSKDYYGIASSAFMVNNRGTITYRYNNVTADTYNYIETEDKFIFMQYGDKYYLLSYKGKEETPVLPYKINNRTYYCQYMDNTLSNIKLSNDFIEIPDQMFLNSKYLNSIKIPVSVLSIGSRAFDGCSSLTSIEIPSSITSIGSRVFCGCSSLTNIEIPVSVLNIGSSAFSGCSSLTSIEIPSSVTAIGDCAFYGCSSLTSIEIPSNITSIGSSAFSGCSSLTSITLPFVGNGSAKTHFGYIFGATTYKENSYYVPTSLKKVILNNTIYISHDAFSGCSSLTSIEIPSSVTVIGDCAFSGCSSLTSIEIPSSVTVIGDCIFSGCSSLTSIEIPNSVTSIGDDAFSGCSSLTSIEIPSSVTVIGDCAFSGCSSLTSIEIPSSVTVIGDCIFSGCSSLTSIEIPNSVTSIGDDAFSGCSSLTSIEIPNSVTSIGSHAFYNCSSLTNVVFPKSITYIASAIFGNCSSLTSIEIPSSITSIGYSAFSGCSSLTNVYYKGTIEDWYNIEFNEYYSNPMYNAKHFYMLDENNNWYEPTELVLKEGMKIIKDYQFKNFTSLVDIVIPTSVISIGYYAFSGCTNLTSIIIPNSVTSIGSSAFSCCSSLTSIEIPSSITSIGSSAFSGCSSLTSIEIPDGITNIGIYAFADCSSLTNVVFPKNITYIASAIFENCSSLTSIEIPSSITSIGSSAFSGCSSLTSIEIPDSITSIGDWAFYGCSSLTSITLPFVGNGSAKTHFGYIFGAGSAADNSKYVPSTLKEVKITKATSIGSYAFSGCSSLTSIEIPNSVTSIGDGAFSGCSSLTSIMIPNSVTSIGMSVFKGCTSLTIYCEAESKPSEWDYDWNYSNCPVVWGYKK